MPVMRRCLPPGEGRAGLGRKALDRRRLRIGRFGLGFREEA